MIDEQLEYIDGKIAELEAQIRDIESEGIESTAHMRENNATISELEKQIMGWVRYRNQITEGL